MTNRKTALESAVIDDSPVSLLIYEAMVAQFGDPNRELKVPPLSRRVQARERKRSGKLTAMVWDSLRPDGTIDPAKMVSAALVNTTELPMVRTRKQEAADGEAAISTDEVVQGR